MSNFLSTVIVLVLSEPDGDEGQGSDLADKGFGTGDGELTTAVKEDTDMVFSCKCRVVFVYDVNPCLSSLLCESEWDQKVHGLTTLRDTEEASILSWEISITNLTRN